ncbi:uncharacterized protein YndB with AHSA1/START domain [Murinocardiopsis flavida]|uniref:Uncharacterized protein YndB with AHSA1/START domain n=1 Tax=Murinocardiopsis flavida TaxID=645275 RepID=A0A2P8CXF6_9ACTN|nr:SRPBCC family protein [Murinocardiopsis flavida]PSK89665.1 uncharacterized protein YndB with AHSA1/START domain [Murinocardiopsis flavida]
MTDKPVTITAPPGTPFTEIVREFDAPVAALYRAYVDPALVVQWQGPRGLSMDLKEYDARTGGTWAYTHSDPEGNAYGFHGVFHSVVPDQAIVQTFEFDGAPGHVCLESIRFEDLAGRRARVVTHSVFQSVADRDAMLQSGMETGVVDSMNRLDELLAAEGK